MSKFWHNHQFFCENCLEATGALLRILEQWKRGQDVDYLTEWGDRCGLTVTAILVEHLQDLIWMDQSTFLDLQIFSQESHPASLKKGQWSSSKEGLCLFGITARCHSAPGYVHLRNMFMRPTLNIEVLKQRYKVIRFCTSSRNIEVVENFVTSLRNINNVKIILGKISIMQGSMNEWKKLMTTLQHLVALCDICSTLPQEIDLFRQLSECRDSGQLYRITKAIHRLIDFGESKRTGHCVINYGIDEELDQLKRAYNNMPRLHEHVAKEELNDLPQYMDKCCIEFYPEHGHCLCIESWFTLEPDQSPTPHLLSVPGLEFLFSTSSNVYYKSRRCLELDEKYGDLAAEITKHEMRLMLSASRNIMLNSEPLCRGIELAGQLDALLSFATLTSKFDLVEPELLPRHDESAQIFIEDGRHILQEVCIDSFVPNSTSLGGDDPIRINILTGPNSSGKSVYLKQVALIVYMAQIGCFVPAKQVHLTPVSHIFTLSHSAETTAVSLSQFGIQLTMISTMLREATSSSLLVLDEFGQGTSHVDGTALFIACMEHWIYQANHSPLILAASHLHYAAGYLSKSLAATNTRFNSMGYTCNKGELIFLYQPVPDLCGNSFPFTVARGAGVPSCIISRSKEVLEAIQSGTELLPLPSIWNESTTHQLKHNMMKIISVNPSNIDELKQSIRRNVMGIFLLDTPRRHCSSP